MRLVLCLFITLLSASALAAPKIQVAILLDTSNSMDGLINQTRDQLWRVVNKLSTAERAGQRAQLELALYEYGNSAIPADQAYVRQVLPLTTDLDRVSEALFSLTTNGGDEFCGAVIARSLAELPWSDGPADLRLIYIAGNEPFTQGPEAPEAAVRRALARGVIVNTLFAGTEGDPESLGWKSGARAGEGTFVAIDQNRPVRAVAAPQDAELSRLSDELNQTYVPYGAEGAGAKERQRAQDVNAKRLSAGSSSARAEAKASNLYDNRKWDLVDAARGGVSVGSVAPSALPAELRAMSVPERERFVESKSKERAALKGRISKLAKEREEFLKRAATQESKPSKSVKSMDEALLESLEQQATERSFRF